MKIDFTAKILDLSGETILAPAIPGRKDEPRDFILRDVCTNALLSMAMRAAPDGNFYPAEAIDGKEKIRRYRLADKIFGTLEPITLKAEDVVLLKDRIAAIYGPLIMGRAWDLIEPQTEPDPEAK